ncbi:DUF4468 domain-containing protein [Mucilaginibacter sp. BT774]|uniref:DUF4468 domain-containing protein n=1 Tax=Mucilaginibacter sp. BT774 TaxID=3062276 RepID=UPI002676BA56|nr:DUF4468 domain-containing protein [Mucilaginibacter sp. BT774]MDO3628784.1 DUF4468 domain-containing protein [Mucilaginibacter sp. BT774]
MKTILLLIASLAISAAVNAQKSLLSIDENNKYIYYQVVDMPGIKADSLQKNMVLFIKEFYPKEKSLQVTNPGASVKDKFLTYTSLVKHENGEMTYALNVECKDGKYRYWVTDFVFTPYEKNRYGMFTPVSGMYITLEKVSDKLPKKDVEGYFEQTGAFCKQLGDKLKKYMAEGKPQQPKENKPVKKIVTDKW